MNFPEVARAVAHAPRDSVCVGISAASHRRVERNAPRLSRFLLSALLAFTCASVCLRAETTLSVPTAPASGVTIRLATPHTQLPHFGFLPVRVFVENLTSRDGSWEFQFQVGSRGYASAVLTTRHTVAAPAGQTREAWLYVPVAQAGFAINAGGSGGGASGVRVNVVKIPTGTKVTRTRLSTSGRPLMSEVVELNEITGEMTMRTLNANNSVISSNTSRPPPAQDVVFTIDPSSGYVTPRYSRAVTAGVVKVTIVTTPPTSPSARMQSAAPKVTITPTPTGTKLTRVTNMGTQSTTEETEFDTAAGVITVTRTMPGGRVVANTRNMPAKPDTETIYTINPTTGSYTISTATVPTSGSPPKFTVVTGSASGAGAPALAAAPMVVSAPPGVAASTPFAVEVTGPGIAGLTRLALPNAAASVMRPFAVSAAIEGPLRAALASEVRGAPNLSTVAPAQLPADWRMWSSFAGVVLTAEEFSTLDGGHRAALRGWVGLGGQLYLVPAAEGAAQIESVGAGRVVTLTGPMTALSGSVLRDALRIYSETPALPDRETLFLKDTALGEEIKDEAPDSSWIAVFLVTFAAIIGPVNLFVFAPQAKRHRLFWTTPALALLGGAVLVAMIFFQDGLGGKGRRSTLVVLLPGQNQAAVFQEQAARTGFLTRRAFALDDDLLIAPLAIEADNLRFGLDTTGVTRIDGQAGGDWFRSRARPAHLLRRLAPTRGRVEIAGTAADGAPIVESSLATTLREFVLTDAAGKAWTAEKVLPGTRIALSAAGREMVADSAILGGSRGFVLACEAATSPVKGRWWANGGETELGPIATLSSLRWAEDIVVYTGVAETPAAASVKGGGR